MIKDRMFFRFALYGFLKNLRFFEPFIILFFRDGGLSFLQIGSLYSIRDLVTNLFEIPTGIFADAFGRRLSMIAAFISYICSFIIFYSVANFYLYAVAMIFFAFGEAFRSGTHKALILEHLKLNQMENLKVAYYGRTRSASQLGSAVNSLIAAALVFYTGDYRTMFLASTVPYVLDLVNLMTYPRALDGELVRPHSMGAVFAQVKTTLKAFWAIFADRHATRAIMNSASFTAFFKSTKDYLQPILNTFALSLPLLVALENTKRSAVIVGIVYFVIYLLTSYASRSAAKVSERFANVCQAVNLIYLGGAAALFMAGVASWQNLALLSILVFLGLYVLQNLRKPMTVAVISDQISNQVMASGLSTEAQFTTILMVIMAPILGALADRFGVGAALGIFGVGMALTSLLTNVRNVQAEPRPV
jgi:MFS family permease